MRVETAHFVSLSMPKRCTKRCVFVSKSKAVKAFVSRLRIICANHIPNTTSTIAPPTVGSALMNCESIWRNKSNSKGIIPEIYIKSKGLDAWIC